MAVSKKESVGATDVKKTRHRSPAYPYIGLQEAVERARLFHDANRRGTASVDMTARQWGFKGPGSVPIQIIAALKYFGLMTDVGAGAARKLQLTDLALRILLDQGDSPERVDALKKAALNPTVHAELWEKWGANLPTDLVLRNHLLFGEKKFNPDIVDWLIDEYKGTIAFANLLESDSLPSNDNGSGEAPAADESRTDTGGLPKNDPFSFWPKPPGPPSPLGVKLMEGERIVFTHEIEPTHGVRILASGEVDDSVLDALEVYIELQKRRFKRQQAKPSNEGGES